MSEDLRQEIKNLRERIRGLESDTKQLRGLGHMACDALADAELEWAGLRVGGEPQEADLIRKALDEFSHIRKRGGQLDEVFIRLHGREEYPKYATARVTYCPSGLIELSFIDLDDEQAVSIRVNPDDIKCAWEAVNPYA